MPRVKTTIVNDVDEAAGIFRDEDGKRTIEIKEFDLNMMHPLDENDLAFGSKTVIIGRPNSGKSRVTEAILMAKAHICPVAQIFSGSEVMNGFFSKRVPGVLVHDELDKDLKSVEDFVKRQTIAAKYLPNGWGIQVMDDVTDDPYILDRPVMRGIFKRGRHMRLMHIEAIQYPMDVKAAMRSCVDYVFIFANNIHSERQKIYENFGSGSIPTFQDFCDILDGITENHTCMVIDNTCQSGKLQDRVFYYKAPINILDNLPYKFGCKEAWEFHADRLDPNWSPEMM